jgi:hypothetical protein
LCAPGQVLPGTSGRRLLACKSRAEAGRCAEPFCRDVDIFNSNDVRYEIVVAKIDPADAMRRR